MVEIREMIYPRYSKEIEEELNSEGIIRAHSFGKTRLGKLSVLGKGKTGVVVLTEDGNALKIRRSDSPKESLELEARMQIMAGNAAPKVLKYGKNFILMEYVSGRHLEKREAISVLIDLINRAYFLEQAGLEHKELVTPWRNVLVSGERTYIIDYDSVSLKERAFNVNKILNAFNLRDLARAYKRGEMTLEEIVKRI
ncbi:MAG: serine/threonine protein kinase [Metallosphaera sp.]|uniref:serine/threonine protein kinase n=1 Tax=Metallosphaera sp. TaxID=2020860 RepID=UPI00315F91A9